MCDLGSAIRRTIGMRSIARSQDTLVPECRQGSQLGHAWNLNEHLNGTRDGVIQSYAIKRELEDQMGGVLHCGSCVGRHNSQTPTDQGLPNLFACTWPTSSPTRASGRGAKTAVDPRLANYGGHARAVRLLRQV